MSVDTRRQISDLNLMVAGQGGDGSLTVASLLGALLGRRGLSMYTARNVASRIKGGHAAALMRGSVARRGCMGDRLDLLVAFDDEAIERASSWLADDAVVVYDGSAGPAPREYIPESASVFELPFARLAVRDLRRDLLKNALAFGFLTRLMSVGDAEAEDVLGQRFSRLSERVRSANLRALHAGFSHAEECGLGPGAGAWELASVSSPERILVSGNEAVAFGFLAAGGRFFTGYPITPASEILSWLERRLPEFGGVAMQAEDELAAVNTAIGAAMTGVRTMTATSGPGISLMQEGVSHLGSAEIPLVVVDCQRSGPSTGMPTKPEQSDINMVVHGGNGDFPRVVLAPATPTDCFELSAFATALAQRLQGPVYLILDQAVAQDATTVPPFAFDAVPLDGAKRVSSSDLAALGVYKRYLVTDDGISPWAVPGTPGGMNLVTGNERDEWGHVSTDPANRVAMLDKRMRKVDAVRRDLPQGHRFGTQGSAVGVLGVGMEFGVMEEAAGLLADSDVAIDGLCPRTVWPVPDETIDFVRSHERTYVVEHNAEAQLAHLIASVGVDRARLRSILKYDGVPFRPGELASRILHREGGEP